MKPAAHCARAGLEKGRQNVVAAGPDRKDGPDRNVVVQVSRSVERIDRNTKRRIGIEGFGKRHFLGKNRGDRRIAQRAAHHFVSDDVHVLLLIAVGIDAAILSGDAGQRSIRDQRRKIDRRGGNGSDGIANAG